MSDVKRFALLQARVYEFLGQQDEATLQSIIDGKTELAILPPGGTQARVESKSSQVARELRAMTSKVERQAYLESLKLVMNDLKAVAEELGLTSYKSLPKAALVTRLADQGTDQPGTIAHEPPPPPDNPKTEPEPPAPAIGATRPDVDAAAIATRLRGTETEEEGADYLQAQQLDHEALLAVAAALQLTRVDRLSQKELRRRVLKQAIGARRKFAGLRKW